MDTGKAKWGGWLAVVGVILQAGTIFALIRWGFPLVSSLSTLAEGGIGDPSALVGGMAEFIDASIVTEFAVGSIGLIVLGVALVYHRYRARWFFWFLIGYGVFSLFILPVNAVFGAFFLVYCSLHRAEFSGASA